MATLEGKALKYQLADGSNTQEGEPVPIALLTINGTAISGETIYSALISQEGTSDPQADEIYKNDFLNTPSFSRQGQGEYSIAFLGESLPNTFVSITFSNQNEDIRFASVDTGGSIGLTIWDSANNPIDDWIAYIEIKRYD